MHNTWPKDVRDLEALAKHPVSLLQLRSDPAFPDELTAQGFPYEREDELMRHLRLPAPVHEKLMLNAVHCFIIGRWRHLSEKVRSARAAALRIRSAAELQCPQFEWTDIQLLGKLSDDNLLLIRHLRSNCEFEAAALTRLPVNAAVARVRANAAAPLRVVELDGTEHLVPNWTPGDGDWFDRSNIDIALVLRQRVAELLAVRVDEFKIAAVDSPEDGRVEVVPLLAAESPYVMLVWARE